MTEGMKLGVLRIDCLFFNALTREQCENRWKKFTTTTKEEEESFKANLNKPQLRDGFSEIFTIQLQSKNNTNNSNSNNNNNNNSGNDGKDNSNESNSGGNGKSGGGLCLTCSNSGNSPESITIPQLAQRFISTSDASSSVEKST